MASASDSSPDDGVSTLRSSKRRSITSCSMDAGRLAQANVTAAPCSSDGLARPEGLVDGNHGDRHDDQRKEGK